MFDRQQCLQKARQAEELASVVAYAKDKERLRSEAASWRAEAERCGLPPGQGPASASADVRR